MDSWPQRLKNHPGLPLGIFILATLLLYWKVLRFGFAADDTTQILANPFVTSPELWARNFTTSVWGFRGTPTHLYRPLPFFLYGLVFRLAGPMPALFHLFQVLLGGVTAWWVYRLGVELLESERAAFAAAVLWTVHPSHVEALAWISALPEVGAGFFYLLGFLLFLRAEKAPTKRAIRHVAAALAYFPALFFKELAVSFPLMVLAHWFCLGPAESWRKRAAYWLPYVGAVGVYAAVRYAVLGQLTPTRAFWPVSGRVVEGAVALLGVHTRLFFWPVGLTLLRTFDLSSSLGSPWPWLAVLGVVAALVLRRREPRLSFFYLWWVVGLLPCLDFRMLTTPFAADRFSYVPSVGMCLATSWVLLVRLPVRLARPRAAAVLGSCAAVLMVCWAAQALRTMPQWRGDEALVQEGLRQSPESPLAHLSRASELQYRAGNSEGARQEYEAALRLKSSGLSARDVTYWCYVGLGQIAQSRGNLEEALGYFQKAVRDRPENGLAYNALGSLYFPRGDYATAAQYFLEATRVNPQDVAARIDLGICWMKLGKNREAREQLRAARQLDPTLRLAYELEARALEALGDAAEAARVRRLEPKE